jgi:hypothetical protein
VGRILSGDLILVVVHCVVIVDVVVEIFLELRKKSSFDKGHRGRFDAELAL